MDQNNIIKGLPESTVIRQSVFSHKNMEKNEEEDEEETKKSNNSSSR